MWAKLAVAWFFLWIPTAGAGTEEFPELTDELGDQVADAPSQGHTDLLAVWLHNDTESTLQVTLKVTELGETAVADYDVIWSVTEPSAVWGVRANLNRDSVRWFLVQGDEPMRGLPVVAEITGEVKRGAPGYLTWTIPRADFTVEEGTLLLSTMAYSFYDAPVGFDPLYDQAGEFLGPPSQPFQVGLARMVRFEEFEPPTRPPDVEDPVGDGVGDIDLTGLWINATAESFEWTMGFSTLDLESLAHCQWVSSLSFSQPMVPAPFAPTTVLTFGPQVPIMAAAPYNLTMNLGSPGFTRQSAGAVAGNLTLLRQSFISATTSTDRSDCLQNGSVDRIDHNPQQPLLSPAPHVVALCAATAMVAALGRRNL